MYDVTYVQCSSGKGGEGGLSKVTCASAAELILMEV